MTTQFLNLFIDEAYIAKPSGDTRAKPDCVVALASDVYTLGPDRVAKDLANFFLRATVMSASTSLELILHVILDPTNQE